MCMPSESMSYSNISATRRAQLFPSRLAKCSFFYSFIFQQNFFLTVMLEHKPPHYPNTHALFPHIQSILLFLIHSDVLTHLLTPQIIRHIALSAASAKRKLGICAPFLLKCSSINSSSVLGLASLWAVDAYLWPQTRNFHN